MYKHVKIQNVMRILTLLSLALLSCEMKFDILSSSNSKEPAIDASNLSLVLNKSKIQVNELTAIKVLLNTKDEDPKDITLDSKVIYSFEVEGIASIIPSNQIIGITPGVAKLNVKYGELNTSSNITIVNPPLNATLYFERTNINVVVGDVKEYKVMYKEKDKTTIDITTDPSLIITLADQSKISQPDKGEIRAEAHGTSDVIAQYKGLESTCHVNTYNFNNYAMGSFSITQGETMEVALALFEGTPDEIDFRSNPDIEFVIGNKDVVDEISKGVLQAKKVGSSSVCVKYKGISCGLCGTITICASGVVPEPPPPGP